MYHTHTHKHVHKKERKGERERTGWQEGEEGGRATEGEINSSSNCFCPAGPAAVSVQFRTGTQSGL